MNLLSRQARQREQIEIPHHDTLKDQVFRTLVKVVPCMLHMDTT